MLRYLYGDELDGYPRLRDSMFRDRADQFATRLGWEVEVDGSGAERDQYDALNPLYVIWQKPDGCHGGSMRFLPTTGPTLTNDHFHHLTGGVRIESGRIWECTRFCLARGAATHVSAALMLGGAELGLSNNLTDAVGVFDARMVRIYGRLGWPPTVIGTQGQGRNAVSVGLWAFSRAARWSMARKAGISPALSRAWLERSRGAVRQALEAA